MFKLNGKEKQKQTFLIAHKFWLKSTLNYFSLGKFINLHFVNKFFKHFYSLIHCDQRNSRI